MAVYYGCNHRVHLPGRYPGIRSANGLLCFQGVSGWRNRLGAVGDGSLPDVVAGNLLSESLLDAAGGAVSAWAGAELHIGLSF